MIFEKKFIITIDGSAWTGKSTVSKALAQLLDYQYLNTGSMFRSIAYLMRKKGILPEHKERVVELLKRTLINFKLINNESHIFVNGEDFSEIVKDNSLVPLASKIATILEVREALVKLQREICKDGGFVVEGRDSGTIVFPEANWKFFLDASIDIKIKRFLKILHDGNKNKYTFKEIKKIIEETDDRDRNRSVAPLRRAEDALLYDNSLSPSAERDAIVLWNYIMHKDQIIENSKILESKDSF